MTRLESPTLDSCQVGRKKCNKLILCSIVSVWRWCLLPARREAIQFKSDGHESTYEHVGIRLTDTFWSMQRATLHFLWICKLLDESVFYTFTFHLSYLSFYGWRPPSACSIGCAISLSNGFSIRLLLVMVRSHHLKELNRHVHRPWIQQDGNSRWSKSGLIMSDFISEYHDDATSKLGCRFVSWTNKMSCKSFVCWCRFDLWVAKRIKNKFF